MSIIEAVELCLGKKGLLEDDLSAEIAEDLLSIEAASRASVAQKIAFGERHGQGVRRLGFLRAGSPEFKGRQCVALSGFSLHAARMVNREDRQSLDSPGGSGHSASPMSQGPALKLIMKTRIGGKLRKTYDKPKTSYDRLIDCGKLVRP